METGHALTKASLIPQLVVAVCFIPLAGLFHRRYSGNGASNRQLINTRITLYASLSLVVARTIFRTAEYFRLANYRLSEADFDTVSMSPLLRYEVLFYVFEVTLMLCSNAMFNLWHPRRYLPENSKIYHSTDGVTEVEGSGYADPRPLWRTFLDPFDLVGIFKGNHRPSREEQCRQNANDLVSSPDAAARIDLTLKCALGGGGIPDLLRIKSSF